MKTYLLGMDGMDKHIIKNHIEEFPNLRKLSIHSLESITPPITVPAWACSFSGLEPDKLKTFDFQMIDFEDYSFHPANHRRLESEGFWNLIDERVSVMGVPGTDAPELDGYSLGGFYSLEDVPAYPESFKEEIDEFMEDEDPVRGGSFNKESRKREASHRNFDIKTRLFQEVVMEKDVDVHFPVFRITDSVMHRTDREEHLVEAYREVDEFIGELLEEIDLEEDNLILYSDHGAVKADQRFFLNTWLEKKGYLERKQDEQSSFLDDLALKVSDYAQRAGLRDKVVMLKRLIQDTTGKNFAPRKSEVMESVDWEKTEAFSYMTGVSAYSGIWINDDRFDQPVVDEKEVIKDDIIEELEQRDEVRKVHRSSDVYDEEVEMFPDLVVEFHEDTKVSHGFHPDVISNVSNYMHRKEGVMLAKGADIDEDKETEGELVDIAPTVMHLLGYDIPAEMDGEVMDIFDEGSEASRDENRTESEISGIDI